MFHSTLILILYRDPPSTPERDRTAERERSRLSRLDMTGTDERRNSRSRSGTPTRSNNPVPQPNFGAPVSFQPPPAQADPPSSNGEDPFRMDVGAGQRRVINLNDDIPPMQMPAGRNAPPLAMPNIQGAVGPLSQEGVQMQWQPSQLPAQVVAGACRNVRHAARQAHPQFPDKIWCTKGRHWVLIAAFGPLQTCANCRATERARAALVREQRLAQEAQVAAQLQLAAQIGMNEPQALPQPPLPEPQHNPPPPLDPLSAISPEDKILLNNCREKLMSIAMESCNLCHEEWFDLGVENGTCKNCRKNSKFQPSNNMYPGNGASHLPELTQMEEMLISPVHALVQLWQIRGGQTKYTGHTCNFPRENAVFHSKVPLLPEECDIIIMRRSGAEVGTDATIYQDFRVRRYAIQQWLEYLVEHHPTFRSRQVAVDYARLDQLPVDGLVHERLRTMENEQMEDAFLNTGPPETVDDEEPQEPNPFFSTGFVPNMHNRQNEEEHLRQAAFQADEPVILTMPSMHGTPISEHSGRQIAIDAFPTLFPTGEADAVANRDDPVEMNEWALHLIKLKGGRFARHSRFIYWVLNTLMRHTARKASNWYLHTHKEDKDLTVEEIWEMIEAGDAAGLAQRVSHAGVKLAGSKPFWQSAQKDLIAQIRAPETGTPHVFFTCSSADIQWPDMHQHMPNNDPGVPENATSYRTRMNDLNNNPAIAAYYFQKRWQVYFEEVIQPKFKIKDYWWRYEWQHRGSSHIHGFFWMEGAPSVDALDRNDVESVQAFLHFWDQHVSTWHPDKDCPPAAIHPSAELFNGLQDTKKELAEILNRLQRHTKCAPGYCERRKKDTGEIFCRFGYPKPCRDHSELSKDPGRDFVELNTRRNDELLNSYNATFILGWRANIHFRPVINKEAVIAYVAKYASKGESTSSSYQDTLQKAISRLQDSDAAGVAYQKMLSSFAAECDISSQETCHILHEIPLVKSSRQYRNIYVAPDEASENVNFAASEKEQRGVLERYKNRPIETKPELANVSLLEFATHWNWKGKKYSKRGSRGAKPFVVNVWPRYQPDQDEPEIYEKYCYARMILHHPFAKDPKELLKHHVDWTAAYQSDCLDPTHVHMDSLPTSCNDDGNEDLESDYEDVLEDNQDAERWRAEWMEEAGRRPNQSVEGDFGNLGGRDLDLQYDWIGNSPGQALVSTAANWLSDKTKESPNDSIQELPEVDWRKLKGEQRSLFLQVMAYCKKLKHGEDDQPAPLRINVDGTAGTGKSFLIWAITTALRELFSNDGNITYDPVVRLAPTGVAAFGIRGWTINFGLMIPVKEGSEFNQLGQSSLARFQTRWKEIKLSILDEKSMVGRSQIGRMDRRLRQAHPHNSDEIFGGMPTIFFGDFAQLPPVGDSPMYSDKPSGYHTALHAEGRRAFESFKQSVTLNTIFRQAGQDPAQVVFREALLRL